MRFSVKWLLAATAYIAIVTAAFKQKHWGYAASLWLVTFCAICYAVALSIWARGERRARAVGFVTGALSLLIAMQYAEDNLPSLRIAQWLLDTNEQQLGRLGISGMTHIVNTMTTMAAGLIGLSLGAVAYRESRETHLDS